MIREASQRKLNEVKHVIHVILTLVRPAELVQKTVKRVRGKLQLFN
jgi:hypothetical protein